jgi:LacI family transcriptional regulator
MESRPAIGIVTTFIESAYWTSVVSGAADALRREGASVVCFTLGYDDPTRPERGLKAQHPFYELAGPAAVDGLVVPAPAAFAGGADAFFSQRAAIPQVSVGQIAAGVPSVVVDNAEGTRALLRHLIEQCGLRRIAYVRGLEDNAEAETRYQAYCAALREHGIEPEPELVAIGSFVEASGARAAEKLLAVSPRPQAIVAANDLMALGVLRAVRDRGLHVPSDIAVAGFDDIEALQGSPALTTVRQPTYELGRSAAELVLAKLAGQSVRERIVFPAQLVLRDSTPSSGARSRSVPPSGRMPALYGGAADSRMRFVAPGQPSPAPKAAEKLFRLLREEVFPHLREKPIVRSELEGLLRELEGVMHETAHEAQSFYRAAESARALALLELRRRAARASSIAPLMDDLAELLPALEVDAFFVVLYGTPLAHAGSAAAASRLPDSARLVFAWEAGRRIPLQAQGLAFETRSLVPQSFRRRGQSTLSVAQPLEVAGRCLGHVVLRGEVYDAQLLGDVCQTLAQGVLRLNEL